ncbi:hypothetical protein ACFL6S_27900 [Candidatus Poribacteria bacterium]
MNRSVLILVILCLTIMVLAAEGSDLPLQADKSDFVVVKKLPAADCRAVRGFLGTPVDGSIYSWDYRGSVREYPKTASDGVVYSYNNNDGLHITLSDDGGFDFVVLRGDARASMYVDVTELIEPADEEPIWEFRGGEKSQFAHFSKTVKAKKVSFFGIEDGSISDVGFYRIEKAGMKPAGAELWAVRDGAVQLRTPESEFAPESIQRAMDERYMEGERRALPLASEKGDAPSVQFQAGRAVHFITPPFDEERGLSAIVLEMKISGPDGPFSLTAVVQDPLAPRLDLAWLSLPVKGSGRYRVVLDIPDQVLLKGSQLWLTLRFDRDVELSGLQGGSPEFWLDFVPREKALPEALARRKMLLRGFFSLLSEPRPWGGYKKQPREEFYASSRYAGQCPELFMTIDQCYALDPTDDTVRQYREWVFLRNLDDISQVSPPPEPPEGVPAWAWYSRLAWLEVRRIANWWFEERGVPTGELGGRVGDDSDFYQQFADLPFFETSGVAAKVVDNAARMAELADKKNLRDGLNIHATDSLHAYEEGINHLALMARWFYGDPIYLERSMDSARNMEYLTILTDDGRRHFRDRQRMGVEDMESPREPRVDGHANPLMWHTAFQVADYNRNQKTLKILREWADTWLKFMKPGRWATDIEVLSGKVTGFQKDRPLYGGYRTQAVTFTWLYGLTGDKRYLEPFLHYYRQGRAPYPSNDFLGDAHTLGALDELNQETLGSLTDHDPTLGLYLRADTDPFVQATIGNQRSWGQGVGTLFDALRWPDMYTTSHQFTDRVFPSLLQHASVSYLGGFCRRNKFNPTLAVSWEGFGTDYAALVLRNRRDGVKALVYSFANEPMKGKMRVWALEHGLYQLSIGPDADGDREIDRFERSKEMELIKADSIELTLPPRTVTLIDINQVKKLDPIFTRADLAIAAREVDMKGRTVTGTIHNIGSSDATDVVIAVVDAEGRTVLQKSMGTLSAPVDLVPKRLPFALQLPDEPKAGWRLVLDPEQRIPEIYEGNNEIALDDLPAVDYAKGWD